jgi:hypothetical protein
LQFGAFFASIFPSRVNIICLVITEETSMAASTQSTDTSALPLLLDVATVARMLSAGPNTVRKWATGITPSPAGFPQFQKILGRRLMRRDDLLEWVGTLRASPSQDVPTTQPTQPRRRGRPRKIAGNV